MMIELTYAIPCYNHSQYLLATLNSIKADIDASCLSCEILIIDDGSKDDSLSIINNWIFENKDINVRLLAQENNGIAKTVNKLYNNATGTYVRLCASDDTIKPGSSMYMMRLIQTDTAVQCVFGDGDVIDKSGNVISDSFIEYHGGSPKKLECENYLHSRLISKWCIAGPCILVRKAFFDNYQYDEKSKIDDFDFFINLFMTRKSIRFLNENVCSYRIHDTNTSKVKDISVRILNLNSFLYLVEKYIDRKELNYLRNELIKRKFLTKTKIFFLRKNIPLAIINYANYLFYSVLEKLKYGCNLFKMVKY